MHDYVRHYLASTAAYLLPTKGNSTKRQLVRQLLPYCVARVGDRFILLNRNYKPLGWPTGLRSRVDYSDPAFSTWLIEVDVSDRRVFETETHNADGSFYYLYGGGGSEPPYADTASARVYAGKLAELIGCSLLTKDGAK